jgi:hypothetical protein
MKTITLRAGTYKNLSFAVQYYCALRNEDVRIINVGGYADSYISGCELFYKLLHDRTPVDTGSILLLSVSPNKVNDAP